MKYANDYSGYGNKVLYQMCNDQPLHNDIDIIVSKLWIIGRSYAASIERKAGKDFKIENAAEIIKKSNIDGYIASVKNIDRLDSSNIALSLNAHKEFTSILKGITGIEKRSLASKYLHFHMPKAFFIYDSIANKKIREKIRNKKSRFTITKNYDDEYEGFSLRCLYYRELFEKELGQLATPRRIDMELLGYGKF
ncbi:hypothetical protein SPONL_542 [uncultured Candidatus Thioglobus sp.]|nr:hypothetical protein SPONL_542 [uncultured Candidatus Thioglobus sp.]